MIFGLLDDKDYYKVRNLAIRYCIEKLNYKNVDILKQINLLVAKISLACRRMKNNKLYNKILKKYLMT
ncbi:MAG: hypothetical protein KAJ14_02500 [Candidatus Omnitrophica bacterium]|nr:hypothetical protein [Candidatus Omnitrophota bacterium]